MTRRIVVAVLAACMLTAVGAVPARADHHDRHDRWRHRHWHEEHYVRPRGYYYEPRTYYYSEPSYYYAPPPVYVPPRRPSFGLNLVFPFHID